jgi:ADP-heptose:LPS heptosyltransferase
LVDCLSRCDLAVAWIRDEAGMLATGLKTCGAVDAVVQSPFAQALNAIHQSDRYGEILAEKVAERSKVSSLLMPADLRREARAHLQTCGVSLKRPFALLHPGSGSRHKCMNPSIWRAVTQALNEQGLPSLLLEGPADRAVMQDLLDHLSPRPILLRDLPLRLLAGVLTLAGLFVGHDSGVTHLAALLGVPTVALFGPTDPARWAPRGPAVTVLQAQPCHCTSWDMVETCGEKPCLNFSPSAIVTACQTARTAGINPRNT